MCTAPNQNVDQSYKTQCVSPKSTHQNKFASLTCIDSFRLPFISLILIFSIISISKHSSSISSHSFDSPLKIRQALLRKFIHILFPERDISRISACLNRVLKHFACNFCLQYVNFSFKITKILAHASESPAFSRSNDA